MQTFFTNLLFIVFFVLINTIRNAMYLFKQYMLVIDGVMVIHLLQTIILSSLTCALKRWQENVLDGSYDYDSTSKKINALTSYRFRFKFQISKRKIGRSPRFEPRTSGSLEFELSWFNWRYRSKSLSSKQCHARHCGLWHYLSSFTGKRISSLFNYSDF